MRSRGERYFVAHGGVGGGERSDWRVTTADETRGTGQNDFLLAN